jgi:hypothetical protein
VRVNFDNVCLSLSLKQKNEWQIYTILLVFNMSLIEMLRYYKVYLYESPIIKNQLFLCIIRSEQIISILLPIKLGFVFRKLRGVYWFKISKNFKRLFYDKTILWYSIKTFIKSKKNLRYSIKTIIFFFFRTSKSVSIQLRFLKTSKMSFDIQKSTYFSRFFHGVDFVRLLSS